MGHFRVVIGVIAALAVAPPAFAESAGYFPYAPPPGLTIVQHRPTNALQLQMHYRQHPALLRQVVPYRTTEHSGTIVVNTREHFLYFVLGGGRALRYGIGTAKTGFEWSGTHRVTNKREWPDWTPPPEMIARRPGIPHHMQGGPGNPLGARALYIGSTLYRIHGTSESWTIGGDVSSGCIRMTNEDVIDLYARVKIGSKVVVL